MMKWKDLICQYRLKTNGEEIPPCSKGDNQSYERNEFERDFDKLIFSSFFRRLHGKTQVLPLPVTDMVHNRMTHSLETFSVGRSLGKILGERLDKEEKIILNDLKINADSLGYIIGSACLAHDIGNPPYGHSGEESISYFFKNWSIGKKLIEKISSEENGCEKKLNLLNFEGNAQGLRILLNTPGLNLTYTTLASFIKYPCAAVGNSESEKAYKKVGINQAEKEKVGKIFDRLKINKKEKYKMIYKRHPLSYLVEASDDICYVLMDFEDGLNLNLIDGGFRTGIEKYKKLIKAISSKDYWNTETYKSLNKSKEKVGVLRSYAITNLIYKCIDVFFNNYDEIMKGRFNSTLINEITGYNEYEEIKNLTINNVYKCNSVLEIEIAGTDIIAGLLEEYCKILLEEEHNYKSKKLLEILDKDYICSNNKTLYERVLKIIDYISGMTDEFALNLYRKIKGIDIKRIY